MASASIHWAPSTNNTGIHQEVQYKKNSSSTWITYSTVSITATTATITGLDDNTVYDFRIVSDCNFGGPAPSTAATVIKFVCPTVTLTPGINSIAYAFAGPGGSITLVNVNLLDNTNTIITTQNPSPVGAISGSFTGLTSGTAYKVQIVLTASTGSHSCPSQDISTIAPCADPSSITALLS